MSAYNDVQLAKITVEIDRLEREAKSLETRADSEERFFSDAWATYGSELAGPPSSIRTNRNKARELREKAKFLETMAIPPAYPESVSDLEKQIVYLDEEIERANKKKAALNQEIALMKYLADVIK